MAAKSPLCLGLVLEEKDISKTDQINNPNKRYLECPGSVKVQHLKKFITMKYGLNEDFLVCLYE